MPSTKTVWGIDVGQCALKALKLQWRDNKLRALAFDVIEHAKILSQPDADEQALIRSALGKFLGRNSIKGSTLVISVPGQASFTRFIKLPPVEVRKIPEIVRYEARQQIPFNLEEVVWDYHTISPPSAGPREVEVGIFAMKRDIVADYVSDFLTMRIEPDIVQMVPVALYNFLRYDKKEGGGATVLADVGAENTNLVIAEVDRVWIRNVPLGGNNFTQALCKEFKLPFSKAENLKRHAAESKHARQVFQAMRPVFGELLTEIQRSIGYYTSLHRDSRIERVVALGNAFRLPGLEKFLSQNLGVEVQKVEGFASLADAEVLSAPLYHENIMSFGVAFGLAVQGLGLGTISTNLLPPEILNQKVIRKKRPYFVAAGAVILATVGCFVYDALTSHGELAGRPGEVQRLADEVGRLGEENGRQEERFKAQEQTLIQEQSKIAEEEGLIRNQSYAYEVFDAVWEAWPQDPKWSDYDPAPNVPPRATLNIIEMLNLSLHYVPDVREYSEVAGAVGASLALSVISVKGGPGEGVAQPGALVRIVGITPKTGMDAQRFVNDSLIAALKKCHRTVRLITPQGEEVLARVRLTGLFRTQPEYQDFVEKRTVSRTASAEAAPPPVDKGNDFWFEAQWVVQIGDLTEAQRQEVYKELVLIEEGVKTLEVQEIQSRKLALARAWLQTPEDLADILAEGNSQGWPKAEAPEAK
ncbi:MAG TPA: type IV pilus assembly protein PilM [Phycisphaerae bacterium]|nr:type IV pilus assembly protein PilM [Phycisphaerae bacterium]